jgi:hypothetical protein
VARPGRPPTNAASLEIEMAGCRSEKTLPPDCIPLNHKDLRSEISFFSEQVALIQRAGPAPLHPICRGGRPPQARSPSSRGKHHAVLRALCFLCVLCVKEPTVKELFQMRGPTCKKNKSANRKPLIRQALRPPFSFFEQKIVIG